jgi:hypothetical protein
MLKAFVSLNDIRIKAVASISKEVFCARKHSFAFGRYHWNCEYIKSKARQIRLSVIPSVLEFQSIYFTVFAFCGYESCVAISG